MALRRILIVDDVLELASAVQIALARRARDVEIGLETDGRRAIERIRSERFDIILSDLRMPGVDGLAVLASARLLQPSARRALMTGYRDIPATSERLAAAALDAVVRKPLAAQDLLILIGDLLEGSREALAEHRANVDSVIRTHAQA